MKGFFYLTLNTSYVFGRILYLLFRCDKFWEKFQSAFIKKDPTAVGPEAYSDLIKAEPIKVEKDKVGMSTVSLHVFCQYTAIHGSNVLFLMLPLFSFCCGVKLLRPSNGWVNKRIQTSSPLGTPSTTSWMAKLGVESKTNQVYITININMSNLQNIQADPQQLSVNNQMTS